MVPHFKGISKIRGSHYKSIYIVLFSIFLPWFFPYFPGFPSFFARLQAVPIRLLHLHHGKLRPHHPHHGSHPGHVGGGHRGTAERGVLAVGDGAVDVAAGSSQVNGLLAIASHPSDTCGVYGCGSKNLRGLLDDVWGAYH